ncbi:hypothetical protein, partial [Streptomyces mirabilis]|uniref:hypothetical protein n=1 Tax=Streptomyces mirabilis TaxID=68239 RepID=UPI0036DB9C2B
GEQLPQLIRHQTLHDVHDRRLSNTPNEMSSKEPAFAVLLVVVLFVLYFAIPGIYPPKVPRTLRSRPEQGDGR